MAQKSLLPAQPELRPKLVFDVDPSWVKSGQPNFRAAEIHRSPDGRTVTGLWACDGPATFEWHYSIDETVHLLEGRIDVEYLGQRFTLHPGDTTLFQAGTRALWQVPVHARKVFTVQQPCRLLRLWRRLFRAVVPVKAA